MDQPGYALHPLRGDLRGYWAVRVSGNWRVVFRFENGNGSRSISSTITEPRSHH